MGEIDNDELLESLKNPYPDVRMKAQEALIALGEPSIQPLISLLKDKSAWFSTNVTSASFVLGRIGDTRAIPVLIDL